MTATENKINHIVAITNGSDIYFPKKLMARRDLADDTKTAFCGGYDRPLQYDGIRIFGFSYNSR